MNSSKMSQDKLSQPYWSTDEEAKMVNGHLRWSSWTQRRLMHIGIPIAGMMAIFLPVALYDSYNQDGDLTSNKVYAPKPEPKIVQENPMVNVTPAILTPSNLANDASNSGQRITLTVNGNNVPIPENGKLHTTISDVSSTTTIITETESTEYSSGSLNENTSTFDISIHNSRSP